MFNHHFIKRSLAAGAVIAAAGSPATAQAMVVGNEESSIPVAPPASVSSAPQGLDQLQRNVQQWFAVHGRFPSSAVSTAPVATSSGGFQWGDAGIGAGGAVVLLGTAALGAGVTRRRRGAALS
jgi:hypothetical protein